MMAYGYLSRPTPIKKMIKKTPKSKPPRRLLSWRPNLLSAFNFGFKRQMFALCRTINSSSQTKMHKRKSPKIFCFSHKNEDLRFFIPLKTLRLSTKLKKITKSRYNIKNRRNYVSRPLSFNAAIKVNTTDFSA